MNTTQQSRVLLTATLTAFMSTTGIAAEAVTAIPSPETLLFAIEGEDLPEETKEEKSPWSGNIGLALNGNSSNTVTFNFMLNASVKRETTMETFTATMSYLFSYDTGEVTDNNGLLTAEQVWSLSENGPWNLWIQGTYQYDDNEGYRSRVTGYGGAGYRVANQKDLRINLKAGLGAQWDYRGNTAVQPQSIFELTSSWQIMDGLSFTANASIANNVTAFNSYLARGRAQLEAAIKAVKGLALTVGVRDEYDSTPAVDSSYNQLWYWVGLQYNF